MSNIILQEVRDIGASFHCNINMQLYRCRGRSDSAGCRKSFTFSADTIFLVFHESKKQALWTRSLKKFDMRPKELKQCIIFQGSSADYNDATVRASGEYNA